MQVSIPPIVTARRCRTAGRPADRPHRRAASRTCCPASSRVRSSSRGRAREPTDPVQENPARCSTSGSTRLRVSITTGRRTTPASRVQSSAAELRPLGEDDHRVGVLGRDVRVVDHGQQRTVQIAPAASWKPSAVTRPGRRPVSSAPACRSRAATASAGESRRSLVPALNASPSSAIRGAESGPVRLAGHGQPDLLDDPPALPGVGLDRRAQQPELEVDGIGELQQRSGVLGQAGATPPRAGREVGVADPPVVARGPRSRRRRRRRAARTARRAH